MLRTFNSWQAREDVGGILTHEKMPVLALYRVIVCSRLATYWASIGFALGRYKLHENEPLYP